MSRAFTTASLFPASSAPGRRAGRGTDGRDEERRARGFEARRTAVSADAVRRKRHRKAHATSRLALRACNGQRLHGGESTSASHRRGQST